MVQPSPNWREIWRYFRKDLPGRLPYEWVDFDFITKPGYGEAVLQRDPHDAAGHGTGEGEPSEALSAARY